MPLRPSLLAALASLLTACRTAPSPAVPPAPACTDGAWTTQLAPAPLPGDPWASVTLAPLADGRLALVTSTQSLRHDVTLVDLEAGEFVSMPPLEAWSFGAPRPLPLADGRLILLDETGIDAAFHVLDVAHPAWTSVRDPGAPSGPESLLTTASDGRLLLASGGGYHAPAQLHTFTPERGAVGPNLLPEKVFLRRTPVRADRDGVLFAGGGRPPLARFRLGPFRLFPKPAIPDHDLVRFDPQTGQAHVVKVATEHAQVIALNSGDALLFEHDPAVGAPPLGLRRVDLRTGRVRTLTAPTVDELPEAPGRTVSLASGALLHTPGEASHAPPWARCFDPATERWSKVSAPPVGLRGAGVRLADGRVAYALGSPPDREVIGVALFTPESAPGDRQ